MLRVRVNVPQEAAFAVRPGVPASVLVPEFPGRGFAGHVARTAAALTPGTRTLAVEVDIDNADGTLAAFLRNGLQVKPRPMAVAATR